MTTQSVTSSAKRVDYSTTATPAHYKCGKCCVTGCKLWRDNSTSSINLFCSDCADAGEVRSHMIGWKPPSDNRQADMIGWYIPAVPDEEGIRYWSQSLIPPAAYEWWRSLPIRPIAA